MKNYSACFLIVVLAACTTSSGRQKAVAPKPVHALPVAVKPATAADNKAKTNTTADPEQQADAFAEYYVVVADTGINYYQLHDKMMALKSATGLTIDTMGRYYNKKKNLIALPDNDPDEIYAGDYFPRRNPGVNLSLEYLDGYKSGTKAKMIALVAGIFETKASADSLLKTLPAQNEAFSIKSKIYVGCMH